MKVEIKDGSLLLTAENEDEAQYLWDFWLLDSGSIYYSTGKMMMDTTVDEAPATKNIHRRR